MSRGSLPAPVETSVVVAIAVAAVVLPLAPLGIDGGLVAPDLLYCLVVAWVVRRPDRAPLAAIVVLGLFADLLLSRPIGLGALALVLAAEAFRARSTLFHSLPFPLEWLASAVGFAVMLAGMTLALELVLATPPAASALARHFLATGLAYPIVVLGLTWCLRIRAAGEGHIR